MSRAPFRAETFSIRSTVADLPAYAPHDRVLKALQALGFQIIRTDDHVSLARTEPDGSVTPMTLPIDDHIKAFTLRIILAKCHIERGDFLRAYAESA